MTAPIEPTNPSNLFTPFLEATCNIPEEDDRMRAYLNDKLSGITDTLNDKKIGAYTDGVESFNGEEWLYTNTKKVRNGYQSMVFIPAFPNAGVLIINATTKPKFPIPNINPQFGATHIWGTANLPCTATGAGDGDYFSFMAQGDTRISFTVSDTTIVITTTVDLSHYSGFIVIEYLRDFV